MDFQTIQMSISNIRDKSNLRPKNFSEMKKYLTEKRLSIEECDIMIQTLDTTAEQLRDAIGFIDELRHILKCKTVV